MFRAMQKHPFEKPVKFTRGGGLVERVSSADEAAYYLLQRWPRSDGAKYAAARETCRDAIAHRCNTQDARDPFVAALYEADMALVD